MRARIGSAATLILALASSGVAAAVYWSPKDALLQAFDAPGGRVSGTLQGPVADYIRATTKSTHPVEIEVTTIKKFSQEGCRRLNRIAYSRRSCPGGYQSIPHLQMIDPGASYGSQRDW